jgi:geranylgeranyl reductase family protein
MAAFEDLDFDVVVAGAGPAGAMCAHDLARGGARVALLEQATLPRYKPCGGGITWKTVRWLPWSIEPVVEREVRGLTVSYRLSGMRTFYANTPLAYTVMRDRFDHYLVEQAQAAGAVVLDGEAVTQVTPQPDGAGVHVATRRRELRARVLVGADGAKGIVARSLGLQPATLRWVAMEYEIGLGAPSTSGVLPPNGSVSPIPLDTLLLDFHSSAADDLAYAWAFPKGALLSVGAAGGTHAGGAIKRYAEAYVRQLGLHERNAVRRVGHTLPCRLTPTPLVRGPALLVGDAAGMVEPFTGEGIAYAVKSGRLAAETVGAYLAGRARSLAGYQQRIDAEVLPDLRRAYALARLARHLPRLTYLAFVHLPRYRAIVYGLIRGERHFRQATRALRPLEPLLHALEPRAARATGVLSRAALP